MLTWKKTGNWSNVNVQRAMNRANARENGDSAESQGKTGSAVSGQDESDAVDMEKATEIFIDAVLNSETYKAYRMELARVKEIPGLKDQIDEFRKRNFILQSSKDIDFDKLDSFEKEYENFRDDPLVSDFLAAELEFCRMMQDLTTRITAEIDFE